MSKQLIAVDPGDRHVGVAFFMSEAENPWVDPDNETWECVDAEEWTPMEFADALAETMLTGDLDTVVIEKFRLYGDKAQEQTGSEFETAQLIGILKYLIRLNNLHVDRHSRAEENGNVILSCEQVGGTCHNGSPYRHITCVIQPADIKKPTTGILRHRKIKSVAKAKKAGGHCVDAELHGWYYILKGSDGRNE